MAYQLTKATARILVEIDDAGSCVLAHQGSAVRILAGGELLKCMPDTPLRLLAYGFLDSDGLGRLTPTQKGRTAANLYRDRGMLWQDVG